MSKSVIFKRMWEIIRKVSGDVGCYRSQVSKSIALKMAYEEISAYEQSRKEVPVSLENQNFQKVIVGKGSVFGERKPEFCKCYSIRKFDVLYIEKNREIYEYFFVTENYEIVSLTKSHFGFLNTAIWDTMLLNHDRATEKTEQWEIFFNKMEEKFSY